MVIPGLTMVMGDLNTARTDSDRVSGRLDPTSVFLNELCETNAWFEPQGTNFFMYKHLTLDRQSHIDYILGPKFLIEDMWLSGWWTSLSDHQVLVASPILDVARGPGMWRFPDDVLEAADYQKAMCSLLNEIQGDDPIALWENLKLQVKQYTQQYTKFQCKQHKTELGSLQLLLRQVNHRIYAGEDLCKDQFSLQRHISQCEQWLWEMPHKNEWITKEGIIC